MAADAPGMKMIHLRHEQVGIAHRSDFPNEFEIGGKVVPAENEEKNGDRQPRPVESPPKDLSLKGTLFALEALTECFPKRFSPNRRFFLRRGCHSVLRYDNIESLPIA